MSRDDQWYWDLDKQQAVPASERGLAANTLGPYPSRAEAMNWQATVEARNDEWDDADDEWRGDDSPSAGADAGDGDRGGDGDGNRDGDGSGGPG
ncbi:MAG: hypothetical protein AAFP84_17220 [Actinomycetota bacterium]